MKIKTKLCLGGVLLGLSSMAVAPLYSQMPDKKVEQSTHSLFFEHENLNKIIIKGAKQVLVKEGKQNQVNVFIENGKKDDVTLNWDGDETLSIGKKDSSVFFSSDSDLRYKVEIIMGPDFKKLDLCGSPSLEIVAHNHKKLEILGKGSVKGKLSGSIEWLKVKGSGSFDLFMREMNSNNIDLELSGSSKVKISGESKKLKSRMSGSSSLDSQNMICEIVTLDSSGSSQAYVYANQELCVKASGSSSLTYCGNPKIINQKLSGSASFFKK